MRLAPFGVLTLGFALACGGGKADDTGQSGGNGGGNGGDTDGIAQSEVCGYYLECLEVANPSSYPSAVTTYGADGTCWAKDQAFADQCSEACEEMLRTFARTDPADRECAQWPPVSCPLGTTQWTITFTADDPDTCIVAVLTETMYTYCDDGTTGTFRVRLDYAGYTGEAECTFSGDQFHCEVAQNNPSELVWVMDGARTGDRTATGTHTYSMYGGSCAGTGTFIAELG